MLQLNKMLEKKSWESLKGPDPEPAPQTSFSARTAGVGGLIRRREKELTAVGSMAEAALSDLDALMKRAGEVVAVVEKYSKIVSEKREDNIDETQSELGERNEMENILQNIGMISPVTKLSAGRMYHQQLAQQIADLLHSNSRLARLGGMVTVTDVYCLYNRARGTELVSPDDFYQAVALFQSMPALHLELRQFRSGVRVIADASLTMSAVYDRLVCLARDRPFEGFSISDAATEFQISFIVAKEQVQSAEEAGALCRDDSFGGIQYFENKFLSFSTA